MNNKVIEDFINGLEKEEKTKIKTHYRVINKQKREQLKKEEPHNMTCQETIDINNGKKYIQRMYRRKRNYKKHSNSIIRTFKNDIKSGSSYKKIYDLKWIMW